MLSAHDYRHLSLRQTVLIWRANSFDFFSLQNSQVDSPTFRVQKGVFRRIFSAFWCTTPVAAIIHIIQVPNSPLNTISLMPLEYRTTLDLWCWQASLQHFHFPICQSFSTFCPYLQTLPEPFPQITSGSRCQKVMIPEELLCVQRTCYFLVTNDLNLSEIPVIPFVLLFHKFH